MRTLFGMLLKPFSWVAKHPIIFLIIIIVLGFISFRAYESFHTSPKTIGAKRALPYVRAVEVSQSNFPITHILLGTVVPITNVTITPRVQGHILDVYYQEGQEVPKGFELELIDPRPYEAALQQARGTLAADEAQLGKARVDNHRYQTLLAQKSTSAMLARDQEFTVRQLEGQVNLDKGAVRAAELNVEYCHIIAPIAGRVGIRALDKGNYVTAGQAGGLTTLTQMDPISVIFTLPQNNLDSVYNALRKKGALPIEAWDGSDRNMLARGTVKALDSQIDTATGTVRLRGIFPNEARLLFPNQFVNIHLTSDVLDNVITIPAGALQMGSQGSFVYTISHRDQTKDQNLKDPTADVKVTSVEIGGSDHNYYAITQGLHPHDYVVVDGIDRIHNNAQVHIVVPTKDHASETLAG